MKKLHVCLNEQEADLIGSFMQKEDIPIEIRFKNLQSLRGPVPFVDTDPEIWILNDEDFEKASALLKEFLKPQVDPNLKSWKCPNCGEQIESQYDACWHCGTEIKQEENKNRS
ncbi:MAG: DUF2007 domain-containing protein [Candidatus Aureabacteria bacterium]|nr:DUF2007 domain-containing protein [Candidatus Auribacterota bacterium]